MTKKKEVGRNVGAGYVQIPHLLLQQDAADYLGVSTRWLERNRAAEEPIPYVRLGGSIRYLMNDLKDFVYEHRRHAVF